MYKKKNNILIIVPVFNEEKNIERVLDDLVEYKEADIIVINDGSSDRTAEIIKRKNIWILEHLFNLGVGASFQTGCQFALNHGYEYIVRMDGDGQHNTIFIDQLLASIKKDEADITIGSRFLGNSEFKSSFFRLFGIWIISLILKIITMRKVTDPTSGFSAMNRKAFEFFAKNCIEDYPEPAVLLAHRDFRIKEVAVSITKRQSGISSITPIKSIYYMYKVLFSLFMSPFQKDEK